MLMLLVENEGGNIILESVLDVEGVKVAGSWATQCCQIWKRCSVGDNV